MTSSGHQIARLVMLMIAAIVSSEQPLPAQDVEETSETTQLAPPQQAPGEFVPLQPTWDDAIRHRLEIQLAQRVADIRTTCRLTQAQTKKLELGGRGDIKRFLDQCHPSIQKFAVPGRRDAGRPTMVMRGPAITPDQLFDWGSLFSKTAATTMSPDQFARYVRLLGDKNLDGYRRIVHDAVRELAKLVDLGTSEREKLSDLILSETTPPLKFGRPAFAFVMFQVSRIPEAKLKEIIPEAQWKTFMWQLSPWAVAENFLQREGFVLGDTLASERSAQVRSVTKTGAPTDGISAQSEWSDAQP